MKNKNLNHKLTVEEQRAGGKKSAQVRREKKAIKKLLDEFIYNGSTLKQQKQLATKLGLTEDSPFIEVLTRLAIINSVKKGFNLDDLQKIIEITGQNKDNNEDLDRAKEVILSIREL